MITAWDYKAGKLTQRWQFDSSKQTKPAEWAGQGNHQLSVADVDSDGKDEIVYGAMALDDNGKGLWTTKLGHGDALHVGDLIPSRAGLEVFKVNESKGSGPADYVADAATGKIITKSASCACDTGRGVAADIWAGSPGAEQWSSSVDGTRDTAGKKIGSKPGSTNFLVFWDGDTSRELLDGNKISKWSPTGETRLLTAAGCTPTTAPSPPRRCPATSWATGAKRSSGRSPTTRPCASTAPRTRAPPGSSP